MEPPWASGCGRRVSLKRRISASSLASIKTSVAGCSLRSLLYIFGRFFNLLALARVDQQGGAFDFALAAFVAVGEGGNQSHGKIVNAVETEIFKGLEYEPLPEPTGR